MSKLRNYTSFSIPLNFFLNFKHLFFIDADNDDDDQDDDDDALAGLSKGHIIVYKTL